MDERAQRWERRFEWPMIIAALLVIPLLVIQESDFGEPWVTIGEVLNWGTWSAFAVELIVMLVVSRAPLAWLRRHPLDLIVVVLTPPILPANLAGARLFRLLRVLRLFRLFRLRDMLSLEGVRYAGFVALFVIIAGGAAFAAAERGQNLSVWDGIWWAIVTMATVGYGDITPETTGGRIIAIVVMVVGISIATFVIAFLADRFVRQEVEEAEEREDVLLSEVREMNAEVKARERRALDELRAVAERLDRIEAHLGPDP